MIRSRIAVLCCCLLASCATPAADGITLYRNGLNTETVEDLLRRYPLAPEEDFRSSLLHRSDAASLHLVQIRLKEMPHTHRTHDLMVILKRGRGVLHLGEETLPMARGAIVFIPRGVVHFFENTGEGVAVGLGVFTPAYDGKDTHPEDPP